jgi:hypothetical protein
MGSGSTDPEPTEGASGDLRRDFLAKAVTAVGGIVAAGLALGLASTGESAEAAADPPAAPVTSPVQIRQSPLRYERLRNGHSFELTSTELTNVLAREGLISNDLLGKQSLMRLALLYSP